MASLSKDTKRNGYRLSFYSLDKRKKSIWLGGFTKRMAETAKGHIEHILTAKAAGVSVDTHTAHWLGSISAEIRSRLVKAELIAPTAEDRGPVTLGPFLEEYAAGRTDVKKSTQAVYRRTITSLTTFFGADCRLDSITAGDAERWRIWQATEGNQRENDRSDTADNTVRRRTGIVRQFFGHAVRRRLISENPFTGLAAAVHGNSKRQQFVTRKEIAQAFEAARCSQLRAVIALSRFGGLRVPSEVVQLTWQDVDLEAGRLTINAPKTEHHEDGGLRFCPIFPELRPFLQELSDQANPGIDCPLSSPVITRWQSGSQNLRTAFLKLLKRAGVAPWPKLYHNMRASRQTELLAEFPAADVCDWLGNSQAVAMKHYAMATADSFLRAVRCSTSCSISVDQEISEAPPETKKPSKPKGFEGSGTPVIAGVMGDTGLEPVTSTL
jgi:integrase